MSNSCRYSYQLSFQFHGNKDVAKSDEHDETVTVDINLWRRGVVVVTTAQLHSTKPEPRLSADSNPARGVLEICNGEDL